MFKFAFLNVRRYKSRFLFVSLTIIFGVAFATAVLTISHSINKTLDDVLKSVEVETEVVSVVPHWIGEEETIVDDDLVNRIQNLDQPLIKDVTGEIMLPSEDAHIDDYQITVTDSSGKIINDISNEYDSNLQHFDIIVNVQAQNSHNDFILEEGRLPASPTEVVVNTKMAQEHNLTLGDSITVEAQFPQIKTDFSRTLEIVGFSQSKFNHVMNLLGLEEFDFNFDFRYMVVHTDTARQLANLSDDQYSSIGIYLDEKLVQRLAPAELYQENLILLLELEKVGLNQSSYRIAHNEDQLDILVVSFVRLSSSLVTFVGYTLLSFLSLAMFVGIFVIINTFNIIIVQRTRELSLLRALAFSKSQIYRLVVLEAFITSLFACLIGICLGLLLTLTIWRIVDFGDFSFTFDIHLSLTSFIFPIILGVVVTSIAAILPAIKASRLSMVEGLNQTQQIEHKSLKVRAIIGGILATISLLIIGSSILFVWNVNVSELDDRLDGIIYIQLASVMSAFLFMFIAGTISMPLIIKGFSYLFQSILQPVFKSIKLATTNLRRDARRSAATTNALVMGIVLIVFVTITLGTVEKTAIDNIKSLSHYDWSLSQQYVNEDIFFDPTNDSLFRDDQEINNWQTVLTDLNSLTTIKDVNTLKFASARQGEVLDNVNIGQNAPFTSDDYYVYHEIMAVNPQTINKVTNFNLSQTQIEALNKGHVLINSQTLNSVVNVNGQILNSTIDVGQQISLEYLFTEEGSVEQLYDYVVAGEFADDSEWSEWYFDIMMAIDTLDSHNGAGEEIRVDFLMNSNDQYDQAEIRSSLESIADKYDDYSLTGLSIIISEVKTVLRVILNVLRGLFGLSVLVAFIGIFNTLSLSIIERFREIGILRTNGMTKNQIRTMVSSEAIMIAFIGATVGFLIGLIFSWLAFYVITNLILKASTDINSTFHFSIPVADILLYYLIAIIIALLASLWPARRAAKLDIIQAISRND